MKGAVSGQHAHWLSAVRCHCSLEAELKAQSGRLLKEIKAAKYNPELTEQALERQVAATCVHRPVRVRRLESEYKAQSARLLREARAFAQETFESEIQTRVPTTSFRFATHWLHVITGDTSGAVATVSATVQARQALAFAPTLS